MGLSQNYEGAQYHGAAAMMYRSQPWYQAYMDAMFEYDASQIPWRPRRAAETIPAREKELLAGRSMLNERRAMLEALPALNALQVCSRD
jgi:hypothetical protein